MHAAGLTTDHELAEDRSHPPVAGRVADVVLAGRVGRGLDHELASVPVPGGSCLELLDIRAVARLAHREAARELERRDVGEVALVVLASAEVVHGAAEEPELNAALHQQREVAVGQRLEAGYRRADALETAELAREQKRGTA